MVRWSKKEKQDKRILLSSLNQMDINSTKHEADNGKLHTSNPVTSTHTNVFLCRSSHRKTKCIYLECFGRIAKEFRLTSRK